MGCAFDISEKFDTPVMVRTTTRIAHSKSVVNVNRSRTVKNANPTFYFNPQKYVMLPVNALPRHAKVEERMLKLAEFAETFPLNKVFKGGRKLGIITSGVAYQYAREVFPEASFLKLGLTWPLPEKMIKEFAKGVERLIVIEELDPFLEQNIKAMGVKISGKEFIPMVGELNTRIVIESSIGAGLLPESEKPQAIAPADGMPKRPPLLCPGCPHTGIYFTLNMLGQRSKLETQGTIEPKLVITGDIQQRWALTRPIMYSIQQRAWARHRAESDGQRKPVINKPAVIGDSTFMHSGITGLVDAVITMHTLRY